MDEAIFDTDETVKHFYLNNFNEQLLHKNKTTENVHTLLILQDLSKSVFSTVSMYTVLLIFKSSLICTQIT